MFGKRNDRRYFNELVDRFQEPVYNHVRRLVVSHEDARDVTQETFIRVFRNISSLRNGSAVAAWIFRIATNEALRFISSRRSTDQPVDSDCMAQQLAASEYVDYENLAGIKLQQALMTLPPTQRAVFSLRYYDEITYDEIADILGTTPSSAKVSYHIAKQRIKEYILNQ